MRDLQLFWILNSPDVTEADGACLAGLLEELAEAPLAVRIPFLGSLRDVLRHPDARVRAGALAALGGAEGPMTWDALVHALDDGSPEVRVSALSALYASATRQPLRWVHALFHRDPEVRQVAISGGAPSGAGHLAFYLLADEASAARVRERGIELPPEAIPTLLDFVQGGVISEDEARRWLCEVRWADVRAWLQASDQRGRHEVARILTSLGAAEATQRDRLDDLFRLFSSEGADDTSCHTFFSQLETALFPMSLPFRRRVVASLLRVFRRERRYVSGAAGVCALFFPRFALATWVPRDVRRRALERVYAHRRQVPRVSKPTVRELLGGDLVHSEHGTLDLWALGALLHYCQDHPYTLVWKHFDPDTIIEAFLSDMEGGSAFLTLADDSPRGRGWLMAEIARRAPDAGGAVLALLALAANAGELDFLEGVTAARLLECFAHFAALEAHPDRVIPGNKVEHLARAMGPHFRGPTGDRFIESFVELAAPETSALGRALLGAVALEDTADEWSARAHRLKTPQLEKLLAVLPYASAVPWGKELALAHALADHVSPVVAAWAALRVPSATAPLPTTRERHLIVDVSGGLSKRIADAHEDELGEALIPCLNAPHRGLTTALHRRSSPPRPRADVCAALLASHDDPQEVARAFEVYAPEDPASYDAFVQEVTTAAVPHWAFIINVGPLGNAFLYRFEPHAYAFGRYLASSGTTFASQLTSLAALPSPLLRRHSVVAGARLLALHRWRDRDRLEALVDPQLFAFAARHLDTDLGFAAARILMAFFHARLGLVELGALRGQVAARLPDFDDATRETLGAWVDGEGLAPREEPARTLRAPTAQELREDVLKDVRNIDDLDALTEHCRSRKPSIVHEAASRLLELGREGIQRFIELLFSRVLPPEWEVIADSIALWPAEEGQLGLERIRAFTAGEGRPELRFRLALSLWERGEREALEAACRAVLATEGPQPPSWFRVRDWKRLVEHGEARDFALRLVGSPHPHAYRPAVELLLRGLGEGSSTDSAENLAALRLFLEAGTQRIGELRRRVAAVLLDRGDPTGFPIIISELFRGEPVDHGALLRTAPQLLTRVSRAALFAGARYADEHKLLPLIDHEDMPAGVRDALLEELLTHCANNALRQAVVQRLRQRPGRAQKLRAVADIFAWGGRVGRELTGRVFRFHMIGGEGLGYTRLDRNRIHVSPLPLLRGDRHGRQIVEALVLHEIGHHIYHRGKEAAQVWAEADGEGVGGLFNLVADEHLERNLRAADDQYGHRLKRLAAYAFAHSARELSVASLLLMLGGRSFDVLSRAHLGVARQSTAVRVDNGALLGEMEKAGIRIAKFVRALRMGLGRRHADPVVDEALEMFDRSFRKGDMRSLLAITYRLRDLFGGEMNFMEGFGGHEAIGEDAGDRIIHGEGIDDNEVQAEVERVLGARRSKDGQGSAGWGGKTMVNVNPNEHFELITEITHVPYDAERHREESRRVARHARNMRRYFRDLGLSMVRKRMRLRGKRFDSSRATAVVTRGDPRMLIAREIQQTTDLFLGVLIDCSGSMLGRSMERAHAFGTLLADAARGLPGVDLRIFGFTDSELYDAGDARHPAAAALVASGGNNDAAALHHVAQVARRSPRKAKLLVMISDGLPTECSIAALRGLVTRLTRREGMSCAQVAVRPLEEQCFPHYVEVMDEEFDVAVRRFGSIIARLIKKALAAR